MGRKNKLGEELLPPPKSDGTCADICECVFFFMAVVGCDSCCKSVRYPEQQGFWGSEAPELLCSQGAAQGRCSSRDFCSGLAQAGAGGQGGTGLHPAWPSVCW